MSMAETSEGSCGAGWRREGKRERRESLPLRWTCPRWVRCCPPPVAASLPPPSQPLPSPQPPHSSTPPRHLIMLFASVRSALRTSAPAQVRHASTEGAAHKAQQAAASAQATASKALSGVQSRVSGLLGGEPSLVVSSRSSHAPAPPPSIARRALALGPG